MANRLSFLTDARMRLRRIRAELGAELREARIGRGLRQIDAARALRWSPSKISRVERGLAPTVSLEDIGSLAAAVGLRLSTQLFPVGSRLRDARQAKMINAYQALVAKGVWAPTTEVPVGDARDLRAIDLVLTRGDIRIAHEFISRMRDAQAQSRPLLVKAQAIGACRLILVIAATHANRRAVSEAGAAIRASFPLGTRAILDALRAGRDPGANGIVLI
jgi:transcriptional regulator with XRE-family HTH domain